jgi:signal transduction histidine kinase
VSRDHLGLFDTPPDRQEIRFALAIVGLLIVALLLLLPVHAVRWREIDAFVPTIDAFMLFTELIIATLLYAQASVFRSRALTVLATGYFFAGLLLIPHALTFPGAFAPNGLLGAGVNTTGWIALFRRMVFPIAIILYAYLKRADLSAQSAMERRSPKIFAGALAAITLAAAVTMLATIGQDLLPPLFLNRSDTIYTNLLMVNFVTIALSIGGMAKLFSNRKSVLDTWLLVALFGWLGHALLNVQDTGRFTANFYGQFSMLLFSHFVVMLALIAETSRLYAQLALSTSKRNRERESRLMSMDAVAAAIAHEAGQPLSAVMLNASASLSGLTRARPDREKAIQSLRATIDDGQRTFDVIRSIRAMFATGPGTATEFSLNDVVRETASLLDRELAAAKVSLEIELDEDLPSTSGSRVQIQRVLINLLTNAIESLSAIKGRSRQIAIRSVPLDGVNVLLEISDTGVGIPPEKLPRIFEAFFTTKSTGTGLGLSLCRTIVAEHGGRVWASSGEGHGATFHLRLPSSGLRGP